VATLTVGLRAGLFCLTAIPIGNVVVFAGLGLSRSPRSRTPVDAMWVSAYLYMTPFALVYTPR
jgi:hypothetical protein